MKRNKKEIMPSKEQPDDEGRWPEIERFMDRIKYDLENFINPIDETRIPLKRMISSRDYPPVDIMDEGDHFEVEAELPGYEKGNVDVEVTDTSIRISFSEDEQKEDKNRDFVLKERSRFRSSRTIKLPDKIISEKVDGNMKDGVLKLVMPKNEPTPLNRPRKIELK